MKPIRLLTFLLLLPLAFAAHAGEAVDPHHLKLVGDSWPPYVDAGLPGKGAATEVVTTALKRAGYSSEVEIRDWAHVKKGAELGIYDGLIAAWKTPAREQRFLFSEPYLVSHIHLVKRRDADFDFKDVEKIPGLVVGVVRDYRYSPRTYHNDNLILVEASHVLQNLDRLQKGEIDLTLADARVLKYLISKHFPHQARNFVISPQEWSQRPVHFAVSKMNPRHVEIIGAFNRALEGMRKDGTLREIYRRHLEGE
ncbi:MAG: hypothetical protein D6717_10420 [Gammaproteobacteria bacterium]|nr:MAG: hypothetical protein D6717_10420 [Gammaproteobacteria bacterium]